MFGSPTMHQDDAHDFDGGMLRADRISRLYGFPIRSILPEVCTYNRLAVHEVQRSSSCTKGMP